MKYGQIAGNNKINTLIYECFEYICVEDERRFLKKFRNQSEHSDEIMHTLRELVLGAYLCSQGLRARYEFVIDNRTPDWSILDSCLKPCAIVELTNFHIDRGTESEIEKQRSAKGVACVWRDGNCDNVARLYQAIWHKAQTYRALVRALKIPYIIGLFCDFRAAIDQEEILSCLFDKESGLFRQCPELSGILNFQEHCGRYTFNYTRNPSTPYDFLSGAFPSGTA